MMPWISLRPFIAIALAFAFLIAEEITGRPISPQPQSTYIPPQPHNPATAAAQSVHATGLPQSTMVSQNLGGGSGGAFRKRLNTFLDDEAAAEADAAEADATGLSKEEMLKNAKERKKVAKNNFNYKKGM